MPESGRKKGSGAGVKLSYLQFAEALELELTPAQREFARVAFDGGVPCPCEICRELWGTWDKATNVARWVVAAVCGRGSGKSLLGGSRILHLAMTVDISKLAEREKALCPVIAPRLEEAQQVVRFSLGFAERCGLDISQRTAGGEQGFSIRRENGQLVRIQARAATARGIAGRGYSIVGAILDEAAFFRDALSKVNDIEIFSAIKPRLMKGGQIVLLSSPWSESGLLYDLWRRNFGKPIDALVAHAPTSLMRTDDPERILAIEADRAIDPEKAAREYDAKFMTANVKAFFDPRSIAAAFVPQVPRQDRATRAVGGDFAFKSNSSAFAAAQAVRVEDGVSYEITDLVEYRPSGEALKPSVICKDAADFAKLHGTDEIIADGHHRESVAEHLWTNGISHILAPSGAVGKAEVYQIARQLLHEGLVKIPEEIRGSQALAEKLKQQLRETTYRALAGGNVSIDHPLWRTGEHGDLVSALVLALWRAYKLGAPEPEKQRRTDIDELEQYFMDKFEEDSALTRRVERWTGMKLGRR